MADLIPFPLIHLTGKARHVAAMINRRRGRHRDSYYRIICKNLTTQLCRIGLDESEVAHQIDAFTTAVNLCIAQGWHFDDDEIDAVLLQPLPGRRQTDLFDSNNHPSGAA